jgi:stearoyl-CoA desaturase (delta-9 desaturase)
MPRYAARQWYATAFLFIAPVVFGWGLMRDGAASLPWWIGGAFVTAILTAYGYNVGSHYAFTHRLFRFNRAVELALIYTSTLSACTSPIAWAVHHNVHHRYADTLHDPHSPTRLGWRALFMAAYRTDKANLMSVRHLIRDPAQRFADSDFGFWSITLSWPMFVGLALGMRGLLYLWLLPVWWVLFVALAFVFCHTGPYDARSRSRAVNSIFLSILSFGDGNHLEHHRNMRSCGRGTKFFAGLIGAR